MKLFESAARLILRFKSVRKTQLVAQPVQTVCFFSNTALGDTIFNTPVFRVFRQNFPHIRTIALLNPSTAPLFKTDPNIDEILLYDGKKGGFLRALFALKKVKPDVIFILHSNEPEATPLAVLSGAKYVFKLPNLKNSFNSWHSNEPKNYKILNQNIALNRLLQLEFIGIKSVDIKLGLYLNDSDYKQVDKILARYESRIIGFQMGASSCSRKWTLERWRELAILILHETNYRIVLTGSESERREADKFIRTLEQDFAQNLTLLGESKLRHNLCERVINLAGIFSIREAAALIGRLSILVTPDTGPLHIAIALNIPTVGLFGVSLPELVIPDYNKDIFKFIKVDFNIDDNFSRHKDYSAIMSRISARAVKNKIDEILKDER